MQKIVIFQRFCRTSRQCYALAKSANAFAIGSGDLMAYPQPKSDNAMNMFNTFRNVSTNQGSYLSNCKKNPRVPLCFRGQGHHLFSTSRYNHSGLFAPLREDLAAAELPVNARRFYRPREKQPSTMPERNRNIRDHKRRLLAAKYEVRRKLYKALCRDPDLPTAVRMKHRSKLSKLPRNSAFVRVTNRCIISGRSRAVYKKFRLSRIVFRNLANQGQLLGVKKASW